MENKKDILLVNTNSCGVSLNDGNDKFYTIGVGSRIRISETTLREIIDYMPSRELLLQGYVKIEGATEDSLYDCGLTDDEINILLGLDEDDVEEVIDEIVESLTEYPEVIAVTYHNWLKNKKYDKIRESLKNPSNITTLEGILKKKKEYNTDEVKEILSEVK